MKTVTLFILLLFVGKQTQNIIPDLNNNSAQVTSQIVGKWQRCRTYYKVESEEESREGNIMSNICLTIKFNENGKGKVFIGDDLRFEFKWKIDGNRIIFSFDSSKDQSNFLSGITEYNFKQYDKEGVHYLEIKDPNKEVIHFLTR